MNIGYSFCSAETAENEQSKQMRKMWFCLGPAEILLFCQSGRGLEGCSSVRGSELQDAHVFSTPSHCLRFCGHGNLSSCVIHYLY